jgi:hypothetical protein
MIESFFFLKKKKKKGVYIYLFVQNATNEKKY